MPPRVDPDLKQVVIDLAERVGALEKQEQMDNTRIGILEKSQDGMRNIPTTVAVLTQKLESVEKSMIREVDRLSTQQAEDKKEMASYMEQSFTEMKRLVNSVIEQVKSITLKDEREKGWWQVLDRLGQIAVGAAVFIEGFKILR